MDMEKLARLQAKSRQGSKGTPRVKQVSKPKSSALDDTKVQAALKKLPVQAITGIEEANMFLDSGKVLHFASPKVHAQTSGNTVAVYGTAQEKDLQEIPNVISQLGADSLLSMQKMMQSLQSSGAGMGAFGGRPPFGGMPPSAGGAPDPEDDVPDLVDGDEPPASGNKLEELE